jgi:hypothetical protein
MGRPVLDNCGLYKAKISNETTGRYPRLVTVTGEAELWTTIKYEQGEDGSPGL